MDEKELNTLFARRGARALWDKKYPDKAQRSTIMKERARKAWITKRSKTKPLTIENKTKPLVTDN